MANQIRYPRQRTLFEPGDAVSHAAKNSSTFSNNMTLPVHRWFRYSAGFSAAWVQEVIQQQSQLRATKLQILDPFAGSGTVLVEARNARVAAIGIESHPFVVRIAKAKIAMPADADRLLAYGTKLLKHAKTVQADIEGYPLLIRKCYPDEILGELDRLRRAWLHMKDELESEWGWLALTAILRQCSPVGTANWQYVLPRKTKARTVSPFPAYKAKIHQMCSDLLLCQSDGPAPRLIEGDARSLKEVPDEWANLVITSPPYPNNFDYADATRLEMSFFGEVAGWGDLQDSVRRHLIRSCTQHVSPIVRETASIVASPELDPIRDEIETVVGILEDKRHEHGGKKNYHTMIAAYFLDMAKVWRSLRRVTASDSRLCFVVGDSAPYGVHVPVDGWLGRLAVASGFRSYAFVKTRDRNTKWKNRKHRVPLHEGQLWIEG